MQEIKSVLNKYFAIFLLALILRLILMPFFFHPDLKTQYFHANFLLKKVFNIYDYVHKNKQNLPYKDTFNYPPLTYFFLGTWNTIASPFLETSYQDWMSNWSESWFTNDFIFRHLLLLKIPYLIFDLLSALILALIVDEKFRKKVLILWFFNPISLYVIYGISNFDIIPTFFTLLAVFLFKKKYFFLSGISLGIGVSFKIFPFLYVPFLIFPFLFRKRIVDGILVAIGTIAPIILTMILFIPNLQGAFNSGLIMKVLDFKLPFLPIPFFIIIYGVIFLTSLKKNISWENLSLYILILTLFMLSISKFHAQWLIWALPFFIIFAVRNSYLLLFFIPVIIGYGLSILNFEDRFLTIGILSPILPNIYDVGFIEQTIFLLINKELVFYIGRFSLLVGLSLIIFATATNYFKGKNIVSSKKLFVILNIFNIVFFSVLLFVGLFYSSDKILASSQTKSLKTQDIYKDHDFVHQFYTDRDIDLVYIQLKNPGFFNIDPLNFFVEDSTGRVLTKLNFSGRNLGDGDFVKFQFPKIQKTEYQPLLIRLQSETTDKEKYIKVVTDDKNIMAHKIYSKGDFKTESTLLLSSFLKKIIFDRIFLLFYLTTIVILFLLLIRNLKSLNLNDE